MEQLKTYKFLIDGEIYEIRALSVEMANQLMVELRENIQIRKQKNEQ